MELRLPAPCLVVLVGASSSGKSTWAGRAFKETEVVSSDRLRGIVGSGEDDQQAGTAAFSILEQIVEERMRRRLTTVIDTLGFDREKRRRWVALAHEADLPAFAVVFDTPPEQARVRNAEQVRPIPKTVLDKQLARFRVVRTEIDEDGFDRVLVEQPVALVAPSM
ncbi:MAG TPA: AAA family ATPase, partial [Acidimicrobiia bacterium]|nr:AAA family ATPase [Acidimicrobiia bacterium]